MSQRELDSQVPCSQIGSQKMSFTRCEPKKREPTLQFIVSKPVLSLATEINHVALIFCQKITKPLNWFCFPWILTQPLQLAGDRTRLNMMALSKRHKKMQNSHFEGRQNHANSCVKNKRSAIILLGLEVRKQQ